MGDEREQPRFHHLDAVVGIRLERPGIAGAAVAAGPVVAVRKEVCGADEVVEGMLPEQLILVEGLERRHVLAFHALEDLKIGEVDAGRVDRGNVVVEVGVGHPRHEPSVIGQGGVVGEAERLHAECHRRRAVVGDIARGVFAPVGVGVEVAFVRAIRDSHGSSRRSERT